MKSRINPWIIVWLCFATLSIVMSARQSVSVMTDEWANTLGWSKTFIGSGQSVALIMVAIFSPIAGNLADRFGARIILVAGLLLVGTGLLAFAAVPVAAIFIIGYGLIAGVGFATANMHLISTALAKLLKENRGLATGIANSGATAGQFITVPLLAIGLTWFSWRWSLMAAAAACALMALVIWVMLKPTEEEAAQKSETISDEPLWTRLKFLLTNPTFHILYWSFFICGITTTGAIETHFLPYAAYCGFPPVPASGIYGLTAAINFAAMFASGYLTDRVNRPLLLGSIYLVRSLSFIVLMNVGASYEMMFLFAVIYGIFDYSTVPPTASLGGYLFDLFARYTEMWWVAFGTAILAGVMVFMLRENRAERGVLAGAH